MNYIGYLIIRRGSKSKGNCGGTKRGIHDINYNNNSNILSHSE